ncbi:DNA-binding protein [Streptomyces sp. NPDC015350]|uniref:DNA-binding protein n=1 Tax=Streptomyces sp. NPDC015350 TaxID=3364955 RepID=UPI0036FF7468
MSRQPKTLLKALVTQRSLDYTQFERSFHETAIRVLAEGEPTPTVSESQFRRWTGGQLTHLPRPDACRVLEAMFRLPAAVLFAPPSQQVPSPVSSIQDEIGRTARKAQDDAGEAASAAISDRSIEQLRDDLTDLARTYNTRPANEVWASSAALRDEAERHRKRTRIPVQQQELLVLAGQAASLMASAAFDLGELAGARRLARAAGVYGESARFPPLRAYADGTLAYIAYFTGDPAQAVALAGQALSYPGIGDTAVRRLQAIKARAHGHLGDVHSAREAIHHTTDDRSGARDLLHDDIAGEFGFPAERLSMSNSSTALLAGDTVLAEHAARRALEIITRKPADRRSAPVLGGASADLAMARFLKGDADGALDALATMWAITPDKRVTGLLARVARLRQLVSSQRRYRGSAEAAELVERIELFVHTSAPAQLCAAPPALDR